MKPSTMVGENEPNSVTKPSDTYEKGQRKHEEEEGREHTASQGRRTRGKCILDKLFRWPNVCVCVCVCQRQIESDGPKQNR